MAITVPTVWPYVGSGGMPLVRAEPRHTQHIANVVGQEHMLRSRLRVLWSTHCTYTDSDTTYTSIGLGPVRASAQHSDELTITVRASDSMLRVTVTDSVATAVNAVVTNAGATSWQVGTLDVSTLTGTDWTMLVEIRAKVTTATVDDICVEETTQDATTIR